MKTLTPDPPLSNADYTQTLLNDHIATQRALSHYAVGTDALESRIFVRHRLQLRVVWARDQLWCCARDLGRLMGRSLGQRSLNKLDADQHQELAIRSHGSVQNTLMLSESGAYALLLYHYHPENRSLRQWLTHEVLPAMRCGYSNIDRTAT